MNQQVEYGLGSVDMTDEEKKYLAKIAKEMGYDRRINGVRLPEDIERRTRDRRLVNVKQEFGKERRES